jgi:uncharacterized membrane protein
VPGGGAETGAMKLGALLVIIGVLLVVIDFALGHVNAERARTGLLHAGVVLIGIGVLVGHTQIDTSS